MERPALYKRILSLPNLNFEMETRAIALGYKVDTVEKCEAVYKQQLKHKRKNLNLYHCDLKDFLDKKPRHKYDIMYLDLCNCLSYMFMDILIRCENRTSLLYITVMAQRSVHFKRMKEKTDLEKIRTKLLQNDWEILEEWVYINENNSKMVTFKLKQS